jgi:hypothetical protein
MFSNAQSALRGEHDFTPEDIRQLRETMDAMAPIVAQSYELRRRQPELGGPLDLYKSHFNELQHAGANTRDAVGAAGPSECQPIATASCRAVGGNLLANAIEQARQQPP